MSSPQLMNEAQCPVPAEVLAALYRGNMAAASGVIDSLPEAQRIELAMFCYSRTHLRALAMSIATTCDATKLARAAGAAGSVLAIQCREAKSVRPGSRISLGGTLH